MQTSLDLADWVTGRVGWNEPGIGGKMAALSKSSPLDCCSCITTPKMSKRLITQHSTADPYGGRVDRARLTLQ
jgi:heterodisulfide reductase subunit A-like polyferredoxin